MVIEVDRDPEVTHIGNTPAVKRKLTMCKERVEYYRSIGALERFYSHCTWYPDRGEKTGWCST